MSRQTRKHNWLFLATFVVAVVFAFTASAGGARAIEKIPDPQPQPGAYGLAATKTQNPPTQGATITTPGNGASYSTSPITVGGVCPSDLLVQVYNNGVLVGSVMCTSGSFSLQVSLFSGANELSASVFDDLNQTGPSSNTVTVNYSNASFSAFGSLITLTSTYGRRSAAAGSQLTWPLQLTGGMGPYAFSLDWGDGSNAELKSQSLAGLVSIAHSYKKAGIYQVSVRVTDVNGVTAYLQVIAVANGQADNATSSTIDNATSKNSTARVIIIWIPAVIALLLLFPAYWLGRRSQLISIRNKMQKERDAYEEK